MQIIFISICIIFILALFLKMKKDKKIGNSLVNEYEREKKDLNKTIEDLRSEIRVLNSEIIELNRIIRQEENSDDEHYCTRMMCVNCKNAVKLNHQRFGSSILCIFDCKCKDFKLNDEVIK